VPVQKDLELPDLGIDLTITLGIHAREGGKSHGGPTLAEVGLIHEMGLGDNPTRSFLRAWLDENEDAVATRLEQAIGDSIVEGSDLEAAATRVAEWAVGEIKSRIYDGIPPELSASVRRRRGDAAVALIDTGQLIAAIRSEVLLRLSAS